MPDSTPGAVGEFRDQRQITALGYRRSAFRINARRKRGDGIIKSLILR